MMQTVNYGSEYESPNPFTITSPGEIAALLRAIKQKRQLIRMLIRGGAEAIVTSILEVDIRNAAVIIDCAPEPSLNQHIIDADKVSFETTLNKIRILFSSTEVEPCIKDDRPALRIPIPTSLIRLQRREFYRINTSITSPVHCVIPPQDDASENAFTTVLQDISCGGVSLSDDKKILDNTIGRIYRDCKIALPGVGLITTSLAVANFYEQTLLNDKKRRRIGCAFVNLPNAMSYMVQRYITKLERELSAKIHGLD